MTPRARRCAAAGDALRQANWQGGGRRDTLGLSNARLASIESERDAAEDSVRRERGAVAELRAQLAELRRPGVSRGCQADEVVEDEPIVNAAVGAAAVKCREAVEEELRAAAAFAHLHDLLKVAALDAAAAVKEALESKLEASIEREKRLRLALAAAGGFEADEAGPAAARGDAAAAAAARLQDLRRPRRWPSTRARGAGGGARRRLGSDARACRRRRRRCARARWRRTSSDKRLMVRPFARVTCAGVFTTASSALDNSV